MSTTVARSPASRIEKVRGASAQHRRRREVALCTPLRASPQTPWRSSPAAREPESAAAVATRRYSSGERPGVATESRLAYAPTVTRANTTPRSRAPAATTSPAMLVAVRRVLPRARTTPRHSRHAAAGSQRPTNDFPVVPRACRARCSSASPIVRCDRVAAPNYFPLAASLHLPMSSISTNWARIYSGVAFGLLSSFNNMSSFHFRSASFTVVAHVASLHAHI